MKYLTLFITLIFSVSSSAIVIRHDIDSNKYLATNADFPALATFYIDGAHGTLINPQWIITAAHASFCISANSFVSVNGRARKIKRLYVHPDYTPGQSHDIALVELVEPITDIKPASIYKNTNELNKNIWFIGIGGTGNGVTGQTIDNAQNNGILRKAQNTISVTQGPVIKFTFNQASQALPLEGVSGGGDSGGPAYLLENNVYKLLGISSRPEGKFTKIGEYGITEVYTRISFFQSWINSIIMGDNKTKSANALAKLHHLPAGINKKNLPQICEQIQIKPKEQF